MIVRTREEAEKTERRILSKNWESVRLLLKGDQMGFSFHITTIYPSTTTKMWYQNHLESVYCISGEGELEDLTTGKIYVIEPGTLYALDQHDQHVLRAKTTLQLVCVFNPPVTGKEVHDENGVYPVTAEEVCT